MSTYNYIIFHKNCFDGFTSFMILQKTKKISKHAVVFPDVPSAKTPPNGVAGKDVIIMDVAYKYEVLKQICMVAKSVLFIDHHITIHDDVLKIKKDIVILDDTRQNVNGRGDIVKNMEIIYDEQECGASLTWKYFFGEKEMPLFIKYIKDNDIGTWKLKWTHEFIAALDVNYKTNLDRKTIQKWEKLFDPDVAQAVAKKGKIYREYINHLAKENAKRYSMEAFPSEKIYEEFTEYFNKPGEYKVAVFCGGGCPSATILGLKMLETIECDFALMWNLNLDRKEYIISFRSKITDVGRIAHAFGGGGHTLASACSFPTTRYNIQDLFFPRSLPRQSK
jgi:hypothetical protein